jgi:hypothetical protein
MERDLASEYSILLTDEHGLGDIRVDIESYLLLNNDIDWGLEALEARWADFQHKAPNGLVRWGRRR